MMNETKVFLNTWQAYNNGFLGFGWMNAETAIDFIDEDPDRAGGEWFIADINNYLGVDFGNLDYANVMEVLETIQELENMEEYEKDEVIAVMEYLNCDIQEAIDNKDNYIFYPDTGTYFESMDELVDLSGMPENLRYYFDYEAYHRDCMIDAYKAKNGIIIIG